MKQKKILLLIIGFFLLQMQINLQAQVYVPFPDSNAIWSEVFTNEQPFEIETYQYGISGDTVINTKQYRKIYLLNDTVYPIVTGQFCGAIREDSTKNIFVINSNCIYPGTGQNEVILYDFSKSIGDTVFVGVDGFGPAGYLVIDYIDSMLIDNSYRKTIHFIGYESYWIEGIGSTRGLFSPIRAQPTGYQKWELICFNQDNKVKYLNPEFNTCFPILTSMNPDVLGKIYGLDIQVKPNPAKQWAAFGYTLPDNENTGTITIRNTSGSIVEIIAVSGKQGQKLWDTRNVVSGVYLYTINSAGFSKTGKIVVSK